MLDELFLVCIKESMSAAKKVEDSAKRSELYNNIAKTINEAKKTSEIVPATRVEIKTAPKSLQEVMNEPLPDAIEEQVKNLLPEIIIRIQKRSQSSRRRQ